MYSSNMVAAAIAEIAGSNLSTRSKLLNLLRLRRRLRQYATIVGRGLENMVAQAQQVAAAKLRAMIRTIEASVDQLTETIQPFLLAVRRPGIAIGMSALSTGVHTRRQQ